MIGIILFIATWAVLRLQKLPLSAMGFNKPLLRVTELMAGILSAALFSIIQHLYLAYASEFGWQINPDYSLETFLEGLRYNINSVLYEEFLFRGWLLFMLIRFIGPVKATMLSSVAFGIYHWFSFGILGQWMPMLMVFIVTGLGGWMFTAAFIKSGSLALPIGLHFGWNYTGMVVFSNGNIGAQMLIPDVLEPLRLSDSASLVYTSITVLLPITLLLIIKGKDNQFEKVNNVWRDS